MFRRPPRSTRTDTPFPDTTLSRSAPEKSAHRMTSLDLSFQVTATDGAARRGRLSTAHGIVNTPAFMTVGTAGTVKGLTPEQVAASGDEITLGNTYHLTLRPRPARGAQLGGLPRLRNWSGPTLTDDRKRV